MKHICAGSVRTQGYDVSHWEPDLAVHAHMKSLGHKFCIIKADEGANVIDHMFQAHWLEAKKQGMITGAYNFFHPKQDPIAQAHHFEKVVGKLGPGDLGPIIDWETNDGVSAVLDANAGYAFLIDTEKVLAKEPIIYGSPYFLQALKLDGARFKRFLNWIAHYTTGCPLVPDLWTELNFWQWTDSKGKLDLNIFNGDLASLEKIAGL